MNTILVLSPHEDRAQRAFALATQLARREGAKIILLRVIEDTAVTSPTRSDDERSKKILGLIVAAEHDDLGEIVRTRAADMADRIEVQVVQGVSWEVVLNLVESRSVSLVVKPAWGVSHGSRIFFGATALHLFRRCPCPVWVVGNNGRLPDRILAAIDPAAGENRRAVAQRILAWARNVHEWSEPSELHVASAWHALGANTLQSSLSPNELARYREDARECARDGLAETLAEAMPNHPQGHVHLIEGPPRDVLPRFAEQSGFDLIVLGTLGRDGMAGNLLGETAEMILREVRSSVLTISPQSAPIRS